jgi:hypothetical protein
MVLDPDTLERIFLLCPEQIPRLRGVSRYFRDLIESRPCLNKYSHCRYGLDRYDSIIQSIHHDDLNSLKHYQSLGFEIPFEITTDDDLYRNPQYTNIFDVEMDRRSSLGRRTKCCSYLLEQKLIDPYTVIVFASTAGNLHLLRFAHRMILDQNGYLSSFSYQQTLMGAYNSHNLQCFRYVLSQGYIQQIPMIVQLFGLIFFLIFSWGLRLNFKWTIYTISLFNVCFIFYKVITYIT